MNNELTALAAIFAVMTVSCAFGWILRGLFDTAKRSDAEWFYGDMEMDHDRWEDDPVPTIPCVGCEYEDVPLLDEPCLSCAERREK